MTDLLVRGGVRPWTEHEDVVGGAVTSVSKAFRVLEALLGLHGDAVGVSDLATTAELPKSTVHRLLKEMEAHGFVGRSGIKYRLGPLLTPPPSSGSQTELDVLRKAAFPPMEQLFEQTSGTVHLAVLTGRDVFYVEKITGLGGCRLPSRVGGTAAATCTALGKAILAHSDERALRNVPVHLPRMTPYSVGSLAVLRAQLLEARRTGVAHDREEAAVGFTCVAAPVFAGVRLVGAISVTLPAPRTAERYAQHVVDAAGRVGVFLPPGS